MDANTAAPADQQLSDAELMVNSQLLQQQRSSVAAEEAELLSSAPRRSMEQEVQVKRLKALCWDAFQVGAGLHADASAGQLTVLQNGCWLFRKLFCCGTLHPKVCNWQLLETEVNAWCVFAPGVDQFIGVAARR